MIAFAPCPEPAGAIFVDIGADDLGPATLVDGEDRAAVTGRSYATGYEDLMVWRFTENGEAETTFNPPIGYVVRGSRVWARGFDTVTDLNSKYVFRRREQQQWH